MPDLKDTILAKVLAHMEGDLVEGQHFEHNQTKGKIEFFTGSEIVSRSWGDGNFKKVRSLDLSAALIEEASENDDEDQEAITELRMRVGRLPHVPENWVGFMTNPDSPDHWLHKYFIESQQPTRHVYYSVTTDNPFLPKAYVEQLKRDLDSQMAQRMIYGKWVRINEEVVYYAYDPEKNFVKEKYSIKPDLPIHINFDFNIGAGKPMSACLHQVEQPKDTPQFHFFQEHVVEGARTENILDEIAGSGIFDINTLFCVHMDATGKNRDTRSIRSDYDIIEKYLANYRGKHGPVRFKMEVPAKNPPIRTRHNLVNGAMMNAAGEINLFVYGPCKKLNEGCLKTKLLKGADYSEDDSKDYQHVTTAAGYGVCWHKIYKRTQETIEL